MLKGKLRAAILAVVLSIAPLIALTGVSYADGTVSWTGHGVTGGSLDSVQCDESNTPYLLWVFTLGGGDNTVSSATLTLGGSGSGSFDMSQNGNEMKATTGFFDLSTLTASVSFVGDLGDGTANLNISHGCPGNSGGGPTLDCDNDFDSSPQSDCASGQTKDCDNDFDNSPTSECTTTTTGGQGGGQVLGATTQVQTPTGGVGAGLGGASTASNPAAIIGLGGSLLGLGSGLALLNRRKA